LPDGDSLQIETCSKVEYNFLNQGVISVLRRNVDDICVLLGCYTACSGE